MQHFLYKCCMAWQPHTGRKQGGFEMLRLTVSAEDYLMIGEDVKIVFLGGSKNHLRIMIDAPKKVGVVRSKVIEKNTTDPEDKEKLPHYYAEPDVSEKYRKKKVVINDSAKKRREAVVSKTASRQ